MKRSRFELTSSVVSLSAAERIDESDDSMPPCAVNTVCQSTVRSKSKAELCSVDWNRTAWMIHTLHGAEETEREK